MGFDLTAKNPKSGCEGYFRANIFSMILLRSAMLAAGVKEELIYRKFSANDGFLVTALQAKTIAEKLTVWLKGRKLMLDMVEKNENVKRVNEVTLKFFEGLDKGARKSMAKRLRREKSTPLLLNRKLRSFVREFAEFCRGSGGFWVE
jgi:hypothetical protein